MNLRNVVARTGSSLVVVFGIAGVVLVLVTILSMSKGYEATVKNSGQPDRVLILQEGSTLELSSLFTGEEVGLVKQMQGFKTEAGDRLVAGESYVNAAMEKISDGKEASVSVRGVEDASFGIRPEVQFVEGRRFERGRFEIIVGQKASSQFRNLKLNDSVSIQGIDWQVVGIFVAGGGVFESEIWADVSTLGEAFSRDSSNTFTSIVGRLESLEAFTQLEQQLEAERRVTTNMVSEVDYYSGQSQTMTGVINVVGTVIGMIMMIGAVFSALNTMFTAVSTRENEIGTLRALGFGSASILTSVMFESLLLALIGSILGVLVAVLFLDNLTVTTMGANFTQIAFSFDIHLPDLIFGVIVGCGLGFLGGLPPAVRAIRLDVVECLRST